MHGIVALLSEPSESVATNEQARRMGTLAGRLTAQGVGVHREEAPKRRN